MPAPEPSPLSDPALSSPALSPLSPPPLSPPALSPPALSLPGVLGAGDVRDTVAAIGRVQERSGAIPWFTGGECDPWDHVECAMALDVGGEHGRARDAYRWLRREQRVDGSWPSRFRDGQVVDPTGETHHAAYLAVGVWHHWLATGDTAALTEMWPSVHRAITFVLARQDPSGTVGWAVDADGRTDSTALTTGCASIHQGLCSAVAIAGRLDTPRPGWAAAARRLGDALRDRPGAFADKRRFSMDWYYPVLGGAVRGAAGRARIDARWDEFVVPGLGARCVADRPWVTGAETCELALAVHALGRSDEARALVAAMQHLREDDGSYWTGLVVADGKRWPVELSTWTAAAVVLAVDALDGRHPRAALFPDAGERESTRSDAAGPDAAGSDAGSGAVRPEGGCDAADAANRYPAAR